MSLKLIVGLRNPGAAYESTRHNAGSWFVDLLAKSAHLVFKSDKKLGGEVTTFTLNQFQTHLLLPASFMNVSGACVRAICQFYRILPHEILIAHDDLDLPVGCARLKTGGGHGGHNGLRDIIAQLGSPEFHRLRIGIGHPGHKDLVHDYVLGKPSQQDKQMIIDALVRVVAIMPKVLEGNMAIAMNEMRGSLNGI